MFATNQSLIASDNKLTDNLLHYLLEFHRSTLINGCDTCLAEVRTLTVCKIQKDSGEKMRDCRQFVVCVCLHKQRFYHFNVINFSLYYVLIYNVTFVSRRHFFPFTVNVCGRETVCHFLGSKSEISLVSSTFGTHTIIL